LDTISYPTRQKDIQRLGLILIVGKNRRLELPHVEKDIYKKYIDNDDFCLLVIARQEGWDKIEEFKKSKGWDLPYYPDPKRDIYKLFAEKYIPRNYLFDKQGKLVLHSKGFKQDEFDELKEEIKGLL